MKSQGLWVPEARLGKRGDAMVRMVASKSSSEVHYERWWPEVHGFSEPPLYTKTERASKTEAA